jgi:AraC family transcriptional regulator
MLLESLTPLRISALPQLPRPFVLGADARLALTIVRIHEGLDLYHWKGHLSQPYQLALLEDTQRLFFNYPLAQGSGYLFHDARGALGWAQEDGGSITYGPGALGTVRHTGHLHSLTLALRPEFFASCTGPLGPDLHAALAERKLWETGYTQRALHLAVQALSSDLIAASSTESEAIPAHRRLKLIAQSLMVIGLFLEDRLLRLDGQARHNAAHGLARLIQARQALLADLSAPPDLAGLARQFGFSLAGLNAGFKQTFGHTAYALYQRERMREARRLLGNDASISVMAVAVQMGYSNASHFAVAFRKHFGINPAQARGMRDWPLDP